MTKKVESPEKLHAALLEPVIEAAQRLIQNQAALNAARPAGWLMLDGVCRAPAELDWTGLSERLIQDILPLLRSNQQLDRPRSLVSAISVSAAAAAAAGDLKYHHSAMQEAGMFKLTADDIKSFRSAAITAAAERAASSAPPSQAVDRILLELLSDVIAAVQAGPTTSGNSAVSWSAAAGIAKVIKKGHLLAEQLLPPDLSLVLLTDLLEATVWYQDTDGLQLLLQHARQYDQLHQLPAAMTHRNMRDMLSVLSRSSMGSVSPEVQDSWEVYLLLQQSWQSGAWLVASGTSAVTVQLLSALLQQQGNAGHTDRVLQLWSDNATLEVTKLTADAQSALLSALVKSDQQQEAVDLVKQVTQQLGHLVTLWQQQQQQQQHAKLYIDAEASIAACCHSRRSTAAKGANLRSVGPAVQHYTATQCTHQQQ